MNKNNHCYDEITHPAEFVKQRGSKIFHDQKDKFKIILTFIHTFNELFYNLPRLYCTRSDQYQIEEFDGEPHSLHDAVRQIGSLIIKETNELSSTMVIGAYDSSMRTVRSLFEWIIRALEVITNSTKPNRQKEYPDDFYSLFITHYIAQITHGTKDKAQKEKIIKQKIQERVLPEDSIHFIDYKIDWGVTKQIQRLDDKILAVISVENNNAASGKNKLLEIYALLSQHVHMNTANILDIMPRGYASFYNKDEFNLLFKRIIITLDVILALYIILIDCDVYHCDVQWKKRWRNKTKETLENIILQNDVFLTTKALLSSKTWNSLSEFAPDRTGSYASYDCDNKYYA